jgi:hypothetical protein
MKVIILFFVSIIMMGCAPPSAMDMLYAWTVVNEPATEHEFYTHLNETLYARAAAEQEVGMILKDIAENYPTTLVENIDAFGEAYAIVKSTGEDVLDINPHSDYIETYLAIEKAFYLYDIALYKMYNGLVANDPVMIASGAQDMAAYNNAMIELMKIVQLKLPNI